MTARSALKIFGCRLVANGTIDSGVRPPREMLWALARMANGDGSSGHHRERFTVAGWAASSIVIEQKTQIGRNCR